MSFKLSIAKKPVFDGEVTKTLNFENGIEMTLAVKKDLQFESAYTEVQGLLADNKVTRDKLKRNNQGMQGYEAMLFLIGEYNIKAWNIEVDGKPFAINGDNFLTLLENAFTDDNLADFIKLLITTFTELMEQYAQKVDEIKKKQSPNTDGKKKNQA